MILRCTAKLLEWLGGPAGTLTYVPPCDDDWYANVFSIERRKCLVLMHAGTLYPVVVTDVRKAQLRPLAPYLVSVIEAALAEEQPARVQREVGCVLGDPLPIPVVVGLVPVDQQAHEMALAPTPVDAEVLCQE